jgi:hypothetical protein
VRDLWRVCEKNQTREDLFIIIIVEVRESAVRGWKVVDVASISCAARDSRGKGLLSDQKKRDF